MMDSRLIAATQSSSEVTARLVGRYPTFSPKSNRPNQNRYQYLFRIYQTKLLYHFQQVQYPASCLWFPLRIRWRF